MQPPPVIDGAGEISLDGDGARILGNGAGFAGAMNGFPRVEYDAASETSDVVGRGFDGTTQLPPFPAIWSRATDPIR